MISVKNLTKTYYSKHKAVCHALDNVSFDLPDTGLVFVIGKSGSGKSTLLNMIGGLDKITKGRIISFGNDIARYSNHKLQNYRNTEIGFIFQDFHLLEDLTVSENIGLALELQGKFNQQLIDDALAQVDLAGYGDRYPDELSGGQKQRVAIARAIVKKPRLLLADEPTGNLDSKTTTQITQLLHKLSRSTLVLVVSHNLNDAHTYADRILELSDGHVINDLTRDQLYNDEVEIIGETLQLPMLKELNNQQLASIEGILTKGRIKRIRQKKDKFLPTPPLQLTKDKPAKLISKRLSIAKQLKLSWKFGKGYLFKSMMAAFIAACVLVIICLSQMIVLFNPSDVVQREVNKAESISLTYNSINQNGISVNGVLPLDYIYDKEFDQINQEVDNSAYKLVNYSLFAGAVSPVTYGREHIITFRAKSTYVTSTVGTLLCDEQYLVNIFGVDGKLNITRAEQYSKGGVYITDYMADSIMYMYPVKYTSYNDILGKYTPSSAKLSYGYVNGIIHTGYAEKYQEALEIPVANQSEMSSLINNNPIFADYYDQIKQYLAVSYSTEPDFLQYAATEQTVQVGRIPLVTLNGIPVPYPTATSQYQCFVIDSYLGYNLEPNQMVIDYRLYNLMFGTTYTPADVGKLSDVLRTVTVQGYDLTDESRVHSHLQRDVDLRIGVISSSVNIACSADVLADLLPDCHNIFGVYFNHDADVKKVTEICTQHQLTPNSVRLASISTMTRAVEVFSDFFELIFFVLVAALVIVIIKYGLDIVRRKMYEIGVVKALGGRSSSFMVIFGVQVICLGLMICLFAQIGMFFFIGIANDVLVTSLQTLATSRVMMDIEILAFDWPLIAADCLVTFALCTFTALVPIVAMHLVKPINIIKAKE